MNPDLKFQRRQLQWCGAVALGGILAYASFLLTHFDFFLIFPLGLGLAVLPIWTLGLVDLSQRLREKDLKNSLPREQGLFDDAYEVVLLKRQISLTRGPLLKMGLLWGSLLLCSSPFLLWNSHEALLQSLGKNPLAPATFNVFLGALFFVLGRYLIGISRDTDETQLSCTLGGWLVYLSLSPCLYALSIFFLGTDLGFTIPYLLYLTTLPLLVLVLEWPCRALSSYYGSTPSEHPPHCPILPLLQWKSTPSQGLKKDLQYQFGHDLSSGTRSLLIRMAVPSLFFLGLILILGSSIVLVPQGHKAVLLTWGKPHTESLGPGLYLHTPYPMGTHHLLDTGTLHRLHLGKKQHGMKALWGSGQHEDDLLMVARSPDARKNDWPVEVLAINAELGYRWENPHQVLFEHADPAEAMRQKALALLTESLRKVPRNKWWSTSRSKLEADLLVRLKAWSVQQGLGANIVFFSIAQLHPPADVAEAYAASSKARFQKQSLILRAEAEAARLESRLPHEIARRLSKATSQANISIQKAEASLKSLQSIAKAASAAPSLFWERRHLQALAELSKDLRKILVLREGPTQVQELDLESHLDMESFDLKLKSRQLR